MLVLLFGLLLFLGLHGFTTLRPQRAALIGRVGEGAYKGLYSLAAVVALAIVIYGYGLARAAGPPVLWTPPAFLGHVVALLMVVAFIALASAYAPPGRIKATLKHPMLVSIKLWALAHLLVNGDVASILLFGSFLAWAVYSRISIKRRPEQVDPPMVGFGAGDAIAVGGGLAAAVIFMLWLHPWLIGVPAILR